MTYNEEVHIERCINRLKELTAQCLIVDSYSTDATVALAQALGCTVVQHKWLNHAAQFQWALTQLSPDTDWVIRLDADEYFSPAFIDAVKLGLAQLDAEIVGVYCSLRRIFQGKLIRFGGVNPQLMRLWRYGKGEMETRWLDEHVRPLGKSISFAGHVIDHNLKSLTSWTAKHNAYASREVLNLLYAATNSSKLSYCSGARRWLKEQVYNRLPSFVRALGYFIYRYCLALGFLDGKAGFMFHFFQGFWYRALVDAKLAEVKRLMRTQGYSLEYAIKHVLEVELE